jgi:hypothetical protein
MHRNLQFAHSARSRGRYAESTTNGALVTPSTMARQSQRRLAPRRWA